MKGPLIEGLYSNESDGYINKFNLYDVICILLMSEDLLEQFN